MRKLFISIFAILALYSPFKIFAQNAEVCRMMEYLVLAEQAGLDVQQYILELSDQLAYAAASDYMNDDILEQGEAAARLYSHPLVCNNYASCLMTQGKFSKAADFLSLAWHQDKSNYLVATNLARCHFELGDDDLAEKFVNRALSLKSDYGLALQLKATMLLHKGGEKNQREAAGFALRSALDSWNHVSVNHFYSLYSTMETMYENYRDSLWNFSDKYVRLTTPLDGYEDLFQPILKASGRSGKHFTEKTFKYPVDNTMIQIANSEVIRLAKPEEGSDIVSMVYNEYMVAAQKIPRPSDPGKYPLEYSGLLGNDYYLPDSREFLTTMMIFSYYKIKFLEADHNRNVEFEKVNKPQEENRDRRINAADEHLKQRMESTHYNFYADSKEFGMEVYGAVDNYTKSTSATLISTFEKYKRPVFEDFQHDIKTGISLLQNKVAATYLTRLYDNWLYENYEQPELLSFSQMHIDLSGSRIIELCMDDMLAIAQEEAQKERDKKYKEWLIDQEMRAAGMENIDKQMNAPHPELGFQIGGYRVEVGMVGDMRYSRVISKDGVKENIKNTKTGATCSTTLHAANTGLHPYDKQSAEIMSKSKYRQPDVPNAPKTLGEFQAGNKSGIRYVKDHKGNILQSYTVQERVLTQKSFNGFDPRSNPFAARIEAAKDLKNFNWTGLVDSGIAAGAEQLGWNIDPFGPLKVTSFADVAGGIIGASSVTFTKVEIRSQRIGSSVVKSTPRSNVGFSATYQVLNQGIVSGGISIVGG